MVPLHCRRHLHCRVPSMALPSDACHGLEMGPSPTAMESVCHGGPFEAIRQVSKARLARGLVDGSSPEEAEQVSGTGGCLFHPILLFGTF